MNTINLENYLDKMYEDWMLAKWSDFQSKEETIRLIELNYNWNDFCEELEKALENISY